MKYSYIHLFQYEYLGIDTYIDTYIGHLGPVEKVSVIIVPANTKSLRNFKIFNRM